MLYYQKKSPSSTRSSLSESNPSIIVAPRPSAQPKENRKLEPSADDLHQSFQDAQRSLRSVQARLRKLLEKPDDEPSEEFPTENHCENEFSRSK